jgi:hypothetical protein
MRLRVLDRSVRVRPVGRQGPWQIIGYGIDTAGRPVYHLRALWPVYGPFRSLTRDRLTIYRPRRVRATLAPTMGGSPDTMSIENRRLRNRGPDPRSNGSIWAVQVKVTGHRKWIEVGSVKGFGRHWTWICEAPKGTRSGREQSRRECVTALLAHVREGNHDHISQHVSQQH